MVYYSETIVAKFVCFSSFVSYGKQMTIIIFTYIIINTTLTSDGFQKHHKRFNHQGLINNTKSRWTIDGPINITWRKTKSKDQGLKTKNRVKKLGLPTNEDGHIHQAVEKDHL